MLETRKVFIDTQSFVRAGLHFDGLAFKSFRTYCEKKELFHVSTSVVAREVESKLEQSVKDAISSIRDFRKKARILSALDDGATKGLFEEIEDAELYKKAENVFHEFLNGCSTTIDDASKVDGEELLSLYFDKKPPFGDGKKKSEFPDAISILSLKSYLSDNEKIYIVSDDGDLKEYCSTDPDLISVNTLDKLLDIYTAHSSLLHQQVKEYVSRNVATIKQNLTESLEATEVYNSSTWEDAEVDDGLRVINLGDLTPSILYISDEECQITFDIDVEYEVTVTGPDFNNGFYDREEGRTLTFDTTTRSEITTTTYTVEIYLTYEFIDGILENVDYDGLYVAGTSGGIEVSVEEISEHW